MSPDFSRYFKVNLVRMGNIRKFKTGSNPLARFNLEAEASRQGEDVYVRQIVSNNKTYKNDLEYFDWFLVKSGDQGVMTNESKNLLNQYLLDNKSIEYLSQKYNFTNILVET